MPPMPHLPRLAFALFLAAGLAPAQRRTAPTRDPNTPGYVTAKDLPDGATVPLKQDGNFLLGPTHSPAPEMTVREDVPHGEIFRRRQ